MKTLRLDLEALEVTTFEAGSPAAVDPVLMTGGSGQCYTCRFTVCQETRQELD